MNQRTAYLLAPTIAISSLAIHASGAAADLTFRTLTPSTGAGQTYQLGSANVTLKGAITLGNMWRADDANSALIGSANSMGGFDDGDSNYAKADAVSTAVNGYFEAKLQRDTMGVFASAKAWSDFALKGNAVPHGNLPNGYLPNTALSDAAAASGARFSNLELGDLYVFNNFNLGNQALLVRLGNQVVPWVTPTSIGGGLEQVNAINFAALRRAGSVPEQAQVSTPSIYAKLDITPNLSLDGFYQFEFAPNVYPECGTFFAPSDYTQPGCNGLVLNGALLSSLARASIRTNDQQSLANPLDVVTRAPDDKPNKGQFGVSGSYVVDDLGMFGAYYAQYTSRTPITQTLRLGPGVVTPAAANLGLAKPIGLSGQYFESYPSDIRMFGMSFKTRLADQTGIYAELTHRPNQPVAWNGAAFLNGSLAGAGPLAYLAKTPVGSIAPGYDTLGVTQLNLAASKPIKGFLGGDAIVTGEVGIKYIAGLPDPADMPYGRIGFGMAPSNATPLCSPSNTAVSCALDGFNTSMSWGVRFKLESKYSNVFEGLDLTPSIALAWDIKGYSYDSAFSQGRKSIGLALNGTYRKNYFFSVRYEGISGGDYNLVQDRSTVSVSAGLRY